MKCAEVGIPESPRIGLDREMPEYTQREKPVVLWVGEFEPIEAELAELKKILGDFTLVERKICDPKEIVSIATELKAKVVALVPSIPPDDQVELFRLCRQWGIEVLHSEMEKIGEVKCHSTITQKDYDPSTDRVMREVLWAIELFGRVLFRREPCGIFRFNGFYRVVGVECKKRGFKFLSITTCKMDRQKVS